MFGIIRPCRHRLGGELGDAWQAHLCGLCLSLRDDHGQAARLATNYDGLIISVLAEAQADGAPQRRTAGRCALRGMRRAEVAIGDCARLAATVSLVLAAAKIRDHVDDGDGALGTPGVRGAATALATRWAAASARTGQRARLRGRRADRGDRAGRRPSRRPPGRARPCSPSPSRPRPRPAPRSRTPRCSRASRATRRRSPRRAGCSAGSRTSWTRSRISPPTGRPARGIRCSPPATGLAEARRLCDDALLGIRLALGEAEFRDAGWCTRCSCTSSPVRCTGCSPAWPAPLRRTRMSTGKRTGRRARRWPACGLPVAAAALTRAAQPAALAALRLLRGLLLRLQLRLLLRGML